MIAALLLAATVAAGAAPADPAPARKTVVLSTGGAAAPANAPRLPGFAVSLANAPPIAGPGGWPVITSDAAWRAIAAATPATRQAARWSYARSLIGSGRGEEGSAVLQVMLADDVDLGLVDAFNLAMGAARAEAGDARGAMAALAGGALATNPEACAWRLWSLSSLDQPAAALAQIRCAMPALNARAPINRAPFLYAGARAALAAGRPEPVSAWLSSLRDDDPGANLFRGRAALALGDIRVARLRLARVAGGTNQQQIDARVSLIEAELATTAPSPAVIATIDHLAFVWRGDAIEQRLLRLSYRIGVARHDVRRQLASGAALIRYGNLGDQAAPLLAELQALLAGALAPGSALSLAAAAGLYWEYRDLAPAGAEGDFLAIQFVDRLQDHALYRRAAELLRHQLLHRAQDVAKGPLSTRVASLFILAGLPTSALAAIHDTDDADYPDEMQWERHRMEAVALYKLGRRPEAMAALQDVPDGSAIRAEIAWKAHDWKLLVSNDSAALPTASRLSVVEQAIVLRHAIALAMLGSEANLVKLRQRYAGAFAGSPGAATFDLLTGNPASLDGDALAAAMLAVPSASPAGEIGDLLEVASIEPRGNPMAPRDQPR
jgi:hypothetical protein